MQLNTKTRLILAGLTAGSLNGVLGTGGGAALVPQLCAIDEIKPENQFPSSVAIILPICLVTLAADGISNPLPWKESLPYLIGSFGGGILSGLLGTRIPTLWLHRIFGALILFGGIRCLC